MHTRTRCGLPNYDYGHDDTRHTTGVLAQALPDVDVSEVTWTTTSGLYLERSDTSEDEWTVRRKKFHFPVSSLTVDHIQLDQVGLALYSNGELDASGMIFHSGGPLGNLLGNRVTIRMQAYAGPTEKGVPFADAPLVWQWEHRFWARRGRRETVKFSPDEVEATLRSRFNEITHLAIELEYADDR